MPGLVRHGLRAAVLFATGGHFGGVVLAESVRRRSPLLARRVRVLSVLRPVDELVAELNEFQPTLVSGYPSALALMAEEQIAGRLRINPLQALTAGEAMTAEYRSEIRTAFEGLRVVEGYAASEAPASRSAATRAPSTSTPTGTSLSRWTRTTSLFHPA